MAVSRPLVSVIIPMYNAEPYVEESVRSILGQTLTDLEVVVVDDGSTDGGRAVVAAIDDPRVRIVQGAHRGVGAARNVGLDNARGSFLAWHDADDIALPQRLERLLAAFGPGVGYTHHDMLFTEADGRTVTGYQRSANPPADRLAEHLLREGCPYSCATIMLRADVVGDLRHPEDLPVGEDVEFMRVLGSRYPGVLVPEPLALYRKHSSSTLTTADETTEFAHLERLLAAVPLTDLVTDACQADWAGDEERVALAFAGLCLVRRQLPDRGGELLERAATGRFATAAGSAAVLAVVQLALEDLQGCLDALDRLPDNSFTHVIRGGAFAAIADHAAASAEFRLALGLRPGSYDALEGLRAVSEEMFTWELDDPTRRLVGRPA